MNRETVHAEGVKCVKEAEQYIIGLQTCPEDLREQTPLIGGAASCL